MNNAVLVFVITLIIGYMQVLSIHMTPRGTIYLDALGSKCNEFSPDKGIIRMTNALEYGIMWRREGDVVTKQPWDVL